MMEREFPRTFDSLEPIFDYVGEFVDENRLDESDSYALQLAIEEIFTNMVKYNPEGRGEIRISMVKDAGSVISCLADVSETPFDLTTVPEVEIWSPLELRKIGGLGIHLVRRMVDDVRYDYIDGVNRITIIKRIEE